MAKVGYVGNTPNSSSVIIARQIYNVSDTVGLVTFTSTYQPGYVDVYLNGVRLVEVVDYSAADGTHINLSTDAVVGDVIEAVSYKAFNVTDKRIGISSDGILIGTVDALNFVGAGHTFVTNGSSINCSITGPQGIPGVGRTWATYDGLTGVTTSKKVRIQNNLEVTGIATAGVLFSGNLTGTAVTATTFVGALTGNADTATNASGLTGTPNITVGSVTGTTGSFSGNVTIGGVLTYEDVTNIDAIGIITARSGVSIGDSIFHTGDSNTAIRFPAADTFTVETAGDERVRIDSDGRVLLAGATSSNTERLYVKGSSSTTSGIFIHNANGATDSSSDLWFGHWTSSSTPSAYAARISALNKNVNTGVTDLLFHVYDGSNVQERLRIDSDGRLLVGTTSNFIRGNIQVIDNGGGEITIGRNDTTVTDGNDLGHLFFASNDENGTGVLAASIAAYADANHTSASAPTRLTFNTTAVNATSPTERLRIDSDGASTFEGILTVNNHVKIYRQTDGAGNALLNLYSNVGSTENNVVQITTEGNATFDGSVSDSIGDLRYLGTSAAGGSDYTLVGSDAGKQVRFSGAHTLTVPNNTFGTGSMITIVANSSSAVTINEGSGMTLYNAADGSDGNVTLAARTVCTILYVEGGGSSKAYIAGGGIS